MLCIEYIAKLNFKLKTQAKQLLGSLPLAFVLLEHGESFILQNGLVYKKEGVNLLIISVTRLAYGREVFLKGKA